MTYTTDQQPELPPRPTLSSLETGLAHLRHTLRTPINAIVGYAEMLQEDLGAASQSQESTLLATICECSRVMLVQVDQHLDPAVWVNPASTEDAPSVTPDLFVALQRHLKSPLQQIRDCSEALIGQLQPPLIADAEKVLQASQQLQALITHADWSSVIPLSPPPTDHPLPPQASTPPSPPQVLELPEAVNLLSEIAPSSSQPLSGSILVVDDSDTNREILARQLTRQGYQVATAADGPQALRMVEATPYDLVLLDMVMPGLSGYDVLVRLKQNQHLRYLPVIMISALDEIDSVIRCISQGAEDYLLKPFNPTLLNARISASLEKKLLREQEIAYMAQRFIAESTPVPILMFQMTDGQLLYANSTALEFFGLSKSALSEHVFTDFCYRPDDHRSLLSNLVETGQVQDSELRMQRADETLFWATVSLRPLKVNQTDGVLAAFWDITARKQAEIILRQNEAKLKQQLAALRIEINETRLQEEVSEITGTDFFQTLKSKANQARQRHHQRRNLGMDR